MLLFYGSMQGKKPTILICFCFSESVWMLKGPFCSDSFREYLATLRLINTYSIQTRSSCLIWKFTVTVRYCCGMNETYLSSRKWEGIPGADIGSFPLGFVKEVFILLLGPGDKQLSGVSCVTFGRLVPNTEKTKRLFLMAFVPLLPIQLLAAPFYQDFILWWKHFTFLPDAKATQAKESDWEVSAGIP